MKSRIRVSHNRGGTTANLIFAVLALGLCGLCVYQFKREGQLRVTLQDLSHTNVIVTTALVESRKETARWKDEVADLSLKLSNADSQLRSNTVVIGKLSSGLREATNNVIRLTEARDAYKARFEEQAEITKRANEATQKLKAEAEAEIKRVASTAEERTAVANKYASDYKELLATFEKYRAQVQAQSAK